MLKSYALVHYIAFYHPHIYNVIQRESYMLGKIWLCTSEVSHYNTNTNQSTTMVSLVINNAHKLGN